MIFNDGFISRVEDEPVVGVVEACTIAFEKLSEFSSNPDWTEKEHELLWEASSFIQLVIETNDLDVNIEFPNASGSIETNCINLQKYLNAIREKFREDSLKIQINSYTSRYKTALKKSFAYEFSQGDLNRIQQLVNELREQIDGNKNLEDGHKRRLLVRLENLQSELHKRMSDLDRFWGLVGDAGIVLGKLGEDAKPIVERVREVAEIVWKTQSRTEELPSDLSNPLIENKESKNTD